MIYSFHPLYGLNFQKYFFDFVQLWCHKNKKVVLVTSPHSYNCSLMIPIELVMDLFDCCIVVMTSTDLFDPLLFILTTIVAVVVSLYLILEDENSNTSMNEVEEQCNLVQRFTVMMIVAMSWKHKNSACELDDGNRNRRKK